MCCCKTDNPYKQKGIKLLPITLLRIYDNLRVYKYVYETTHTVHEHKKERTVYKDKAIEAAEIDIVRSLCYPPIDLRMHLIFVSRSNAFVERLMFLRTFNSFLWLGFELFLLIARLCVCIYVCLTDCHQSFCMKALRKN